MNNGEQEGRETVSKIDVGNTMLQGASSIRFFTFHSYLFTFHFPIASQFNHISRNRSQ